MSNESQSVIDALIDVMSSERGVEHKAAALHALRNFDDSRAIETLERYITSEVPLINNDCLGAVAIRALANTGEAGHAALIAGFEAHAAKTPLSLPSNGYFFRRIRVSFIVALREIGTPAARSALLRALDMWQDRESLTHETTMLADMLLDMGASDSDNIAALTWYSSAGDELAFRAIGATALPFLISKLPQRRAFEYIGAVGDQSTIPAIIPYLKTHYEAVLCFELLRDRDKTPPVPPAPPAVKANDDVVRNDPYGHSNEPGAPRYVAFDPTWFSTRIAGEEQIARLRAEGYEIAAESTTASGESVTYVVRMELVKS